MERRIETIDIRELLPQQPPFIMVDKLIEFDRQEVVTEFEIKSDCIFVEDNVLIETGLIENIAQSCAARMGYISKYLDRESVKLGFIGAIKNLDVHKLPQVGDVLRTRVWVSSEVFSMTLVKATSVVGEEVVITCEMKISLTEIASSNEK